MSTKPSVSEASAFLAEVQRQRAHEGVAVVYRVTRGSIDGDRRLVLGRVVEQGILVAADGRRVELTAAPALEACAAAGLSLEEAVLKARTAIGGDEQIEGLCSHGQRVCGACRDHR